MSAPTPFLVIDKAAPLPIYHQIRSAVLAKIGTRDLAAGDKLPAEAELARQVGISPMTVRQAYSSLVAEGVLNRRHGRGTFVAAAEPSRAPTATAATPGLTRCTTDVALVYSHYTDLVSYHGLLVAAVAAACEAKGWNLHQFSHFERGIDHRSNALLAHLLEQRQVDAVLASGTLLDRDLTTFERLGLPVALLDNDCVGDAAISLYFDDAGFITQAIALAHSRGQRRLALLSGPTAQTGSRFRRRGDRLISAFIARCSELHLPLDGDLLRSCAHDVAAYTLAVQGLCALPEPPAAILTNGDLAAQAAVAAVTAAGLRIPVLNFSDVPSGGPGETVTVKPFARLAAAAIGALEQALAGSTTGATRIVIPATP
jgi:DNA-binding LacI/PurR family transcriptional regulator